MARAQGLDPTAAPARLLLVLGGLIALAALTVAASRFSRWWRVPELAVAGAPAGGLALQQGRLPAARVEVPWGLLEMGPQLSISGELITTHPRPDGNLHYFQEVGFPWVPGLRQPCPTWGDAFASGTAVFFCSFASPDSAASLIAFYRRQLGEKGMTRNGGDAVTWVLPRATGNPGIESYKGLTIRPYDVARERAAASCLVSPPIAALAVVTIDGSSRVRKWRRRELGGGGR
jgi:hypothetical protein